MVGEELEEFIAVEEKEVAEILEGLDL